MFKSKDKPPDWVIDSVIQFICSPLFSDSIKQFVEDRCVVFDASDENKFSYTDLHGEYGNLVDSQLGYFMNDTGINPNDFASALSLDIETHVGVNKRAIQNAFTHIEAVDDFLQFKSIMVAKNKELNSRAMEELQRHGMLIPSAQLQARNQPGFRNLDTPPPPYPDEYQEDDVGPKRLVKDEAVESYVRTLSTNLQLFDDAVREQQDAIRCNEGIDLENDNPVPPQSNLYPNLESIQNQTLGQNNSQVENHGYTDQVKSSTDELEFKQLEELTLNAGDKEQSVDEANVKIEQLSDEIAKRESLPDIHATLGQQRYVNTKEKHNETFNQEHDPSESEETDNRVQSPVEAADNLTAQWMEYAKEQQSLWKSSKDETTTRKHTPTREELTSREQHFRRQRDLLKRKQSKEGEEKEQGATSQQNNPQVVKELVTPLRDEERERAMAEEAKKFRKALSAKLKREVVDTHT